MGRPVDHRLPLLHSPFLPFPQRESAARPSNPVLQGNRAGAFEKAQAASEWSRFYSLVLWLFCGCNKDIRIASKTSRAESGVLLWARHTWPVNISRERDLYFDFLAIIDIVTSTCGFVPIW
jgi:hypothetical protein